MESKYRTSIWFNDNAQEAAEYYAEVFPDARVGDITHYPDVDNEHMADKVGKVLTVHWWLGDQEYIGLNGGPGFPHSENVSIEVMCGDQAEVDLYWNRLVGDGGEESVCGWCKDKFGFSWQIVPKRFLELLADPATEVAATKAMFTMKKLDVARLEAAARGEQ